MISIMLKSTSLRMQQNEITESAIYENLSKSAKGEENKKVLHRLSQEEHAHHEIWKKYTEKELKPNKWKVFKYTMIAKHFLGVDI